MTDACKPPFPRVAVIGVGLLGGSFGLAMKQRRLVGEICGVGRSAERLKRAREIGAIDRYTRDPAEGCAEADLVLLASPVAHVIEMLPTIAKVSRPGVLVTDVGSTKASVVKAAEAVFPPDKYFVGSHPMAGSEKSGVPHATGSLFEEACCLITMTSRTDLDALARVVELWRSLGCRIVITDPERHDRLVSALSHLPHLTAAALVNSTLDDAEDLNFANALIGNGFRDTTRIAEGPAEMWADICLDNRVNLQADLQNLIERLQQLEVILKSADRADLIEFLERAAITRAALDKSPPLKRKRKARRRREDTPDGGKN